MVYFKTAQEWVDQSKLLLDARPATASLPVGLPPRRPPS